MVLKFRFLLLFLAFQVAIFAQKTIAESEDMRFRAQIAQDTATLKQIIADDLVYIHSNALTESKRDFINSVQSGKITYQTMQPEVGRSIRRYGKSGISNGVVRVTGLFQGNPFDVKLKYTAVYRKIRGRWLLVSWQSTGFPD